MRKNNRLRHLFSKLPALPIMAAVLMVSPAMSQIQVNVRVNNAGDDLEEYLGSVPLASGLTVGQYDLGSSDLELGQENATTTAQLVGMRFNNINIPQGAYITSAKINFTVDATNKNSDPSNLWIMGEAADNSSPFSTSAGFNLSSRPKTDSVFMTFPIGSWNVVGATESTVDLTSIISAIVNRSGWTSGNSISLFVKGTGVREAESFDGSPNDAPELVVEYSLTSRLGFRVSGSSNDAEEAGANATGVAPGTIDITSSDLELVQDGTDGDQYVGMRFTGINVPQGATIARAYIQFTVDETINTTGDKIIKVEAVDHSTPFASTAFNISSRPTTTDSVIWTNIPAWTTQQVATVDQQTPDIKTLIQSIVNRSGWNSGNALNIIITGSGTRTAEAYDGSPSEAAELIIDYVPDFAPLGTFPIDSGAVWAYSDLDTTLPATWKNIGYNDTTWAYGPAQLGYGDSDEATVISFGPNASDKYKTAYFRHNFDVSNPAAYDSLKLGLLRDDGAVVYLNGVEVYRSNMPSGTVVYNTLASSAVGGTDENTFYTTTIANTLIAGVNTIAVEVHQNIGSSSDMSFDFYMYGTPPPAPVTQFPLAKGDVWSYLDNGTNQDTAWRVPGFNYYNWAYGAGQLGYGDGDETTVLGFGPDANNKYITYYFVKKFTVDTTGLRDSLELGLMRDDGAIVYLNGQEIVRDNIPTGSITYKTWSSTIVSGGDESTYFTFHLPTSLLLHDTNYIAVEIHQRDSISSDLSFDMYLEELPDPIMGSSGCTPGNEQHFSCFESISPTSQTQMMIIPETHAFQYLMRQGNPYNNFSGNAPGNHDFTGYVAINNSSEHGYVSVNHENSPGGVSILDVHYDTTNRVWIMDSLNRVDMYNSDLVTTTRNCSGGVTPWGTVISSEENTNPGDANADGYQDIGWNVEIDPVTRKVKTYGSTKQEKLWALGRMNHENIVVADDSLTAYEGEDGGTSCVYKFVANTKTDLSTGTLYVLRVTGGLSGGEPNSSNGTWIMVPNTSQSDRNSTASLAASLGGTNFNGVEDVEIHPLTGEIYFTSKGHNRVYKFTDDGTTVSNFETFVGGTSYSFIANGVQVTEPWASGNDNLVFDDLGNLWVLQDGSRNYIWMVRPNHSQNNPHIELFMSPPAGSEPTGATFSPDHRFMFVSIQHPSGSNGPQTDAAGQNFGFNVSTTVVVARKEHLGIYAPNTQTSNLQTDNADSCSKVDLDWTVGNGSGRMVVARESATPAAKPKDGNYYNASSVYASGDMTGAGNYVIYDGTGSSTTVTGLSFGKNYVFDVYEYEVEANLPFYNVNAPATNNFAFTPIPAAVISGSNQVNKGAIEVYSVSAPSGFVFDWTVTNGVILSGQTTGAITVEWQNADGTGTVEVELTSDQGCAGSPVQKAVTIVSTGIETVTASDAVTIYPNPTNGQTTVILNRSYKQVEAVIFGAQGARVNADIRYEGRTIQFDASSMQPGYYVLQLKLDGQLQNHRIIVQ